MASPTLRALAVGAALLAASAAAAQAPRPLPSPPVAAQQPKVDTLHGDVRIDEYFWLRDRQDPRVIPYLEAENAYTEQALAHTSLLQETLYREMVGRIAEDDRTVPERVGEYYYYSRTEAGKQYPIHVRRRGSMDAPEEVVFDQNRMAEGHGYYTLGAFQVSPDHSLLAFSEDTTGRERFTLRVMDLATGALLDTRIEGVHFGATWAADSRTLFYRRTDEAQRPDRVYRHRLGTDPAADTLVLHEPDVLYRVDVYRTKDDRWLVASSESFTTSEVHVAPADRPETPFRVLAPREEGVLYQVEHRDGRFVILTNAGGASNFRVVTAPVDAPGRAGWEELVAPRDSVLLEGFDVFRDHLVVYERGDALRGIRVHDLRSGASHAIEFDEAVYSAGPGRNREFDTRTLRFSYESLVTPHTVYDYDMESRERELRKRDPVRGGYDPSLYVTERSWARAEDGTMVPVSLVYRTPLERDGSRPLLLYAYGSYGYSTDPVFTSANLSLLDRGVIYAIAHVRGGQEMGRGWYEDGMMLRKMNTFTDFIAVGEHLVREGYTSSRRMAARGGSAGGLLVGVVANLRPELFRAIVADVPFVDVVNTMADASIPLTTGEWIQWGNPVASEEEYRYLLSYSPYDNVRAMDYPAMLVTTGLNDPRVAYWEPAKWVARLRALRTDDELLLLRTHMGAGHGGASGRYDALREVAFRFAFVLDQLGVEAP